METINERRKSYQTVHNIGNIEDLFEVRHECLQKLC